MVGAWIAKRFVLRLHPDRFRLLMDALMLLSGLTMLWTAFIGVCVLNYDIPSRGANRHSP